MIFNLNNVRTNASSFNISQSNPKWRTTLNPLQSYYPNSCELWSKQGDDVLSFYNIIFYEPQRPNLATQGCRRFSVGLLFEVEDESREDSADLPLLEEQFQESQTRFC